MKYLGRRLAALFVAALFCVASGCSHNSPDKNALDQQKKDVLGGPPPASAQAEVDAAKARAGVAIGKVNPPPAGK